MTGGGLTCPFCGSADVELVAAWGGQLITSQMRCRACNTHFEALRDDFAGARDVAGAEGQETPSTSS
ncbi:MAG TPA: hypothetical protein VHX62_06775 [Solirubrobacteraceae bacterium]|jgi:hypothetical protein|nr:hypothetical protein [Solirubrobacteraceae bacterium]